MLEKNTDTLWALEQTLRCKSFGAVVAWPESIRDRDVRRLQLAAEAGVAWDLFIAHQRPHVSASPAADAICDFCPRIRGDLRNRCSEVPTGATSACALVKCNDHRRHLQLAITEEQCDKFRASHNLD